MLLILSVNDRCFTLGRKTRDFMKMCENLFKSGM